MKNSFEALQTAISGLTDQMAAEARWKKTMEDRMQQVVALQSSLAVLEREKNTESLNQAIRKEANKNKRAVGKKGDDQEEEVDVVEQLRELCFWEQCYHRWGYHIVLTKFVHVLQTCLPTVGRRSLKIRII
jgi:hypothetical protein